MINLFCLIIQFQQEVLVYDEESGEYQKYLYIAADQQQEEEEVVESIEEHQHHKELNGLEQVGWDPKFISASGVWIIYSVSSYSGMLKSERPKSKRNGLPFPDVRISDVRFVRSFGLSSYV